MASFFASVFACCFRLRGGRRRAGTGVADIETPNERTHLIPPVGDAEGYGTPSPADALAISQQKLKERLTSIVRSKEGKMVNVNARLPFNLHNQKLSVSIDPSQPYFVRARPHSSSQSQSHSNSNSNSQSSSSRSPSTSTSHNQRPAHTHGHTLSPSPLSATPIQAAHAHVGAPLEHQHTSSSSSLSALAQTQAPVQAGEEVSRSSSMASRRAPSLVDGGDSAERDRSIRGPILNLRLVTSTSARSGSALSRTSSTGGGASASAASSTVSGGQPQDQQAQAQVVARGRAKKKASDDTEVGVAGGAVLAEALSIGGAAAGVAPAVGTAPGMGPAAAGGVGTAGGDEDMSTPQQSQFLPRTVSNTHPTNLTPDGVAPSSTSASLPTSSSSSASRPVDIPTQPRVSVSPSPSRSGRVPAPAPVPTFVLESTAPIVVSWGD